MPARRKQHDRQHSEKRVPPRPPNYCIYCLARLCAWLQRLASNNHIWSEVVTTPPPPLCYRCPTFQVEAAPSSQVLETAYKGCRCCLWRQTGTDIVYGVAKTELLNSAVWGRKGLFGSCFRGDFGPSQQRRHGTRSIWCHAQQQEQRWKAPSR